MEKIRLGRTGLMVTRTAFGALPIQRVKDSSEVKQILISAYDRGINLFDTARNYSDSEEKIGYSLSGVRKNIYIATKSSASTKDGVLSDLEKSLVNLKTDYVDILQLHNPAPLPDPDDKNSAYAGLLMAKQQGKARFIGLSQHGLGRAKDAVVSNLYDTIQFPLSPVSQPQDLELAGLAKEHDVGVIAMKALCGGLLTNVRACFAFFRQFDNVAPIWGIQRMSELEEICRYDANPPALDAKMLAELDIQKKELGQTFCRACGYCMPCPAGIQIPMAARMKFLLRRAPSENFITDKWKAEMAKIENCIECGECKKRCPYGLNTPAILKMMLEDYKQFIS